MMAEGKERTEKGKRIGEREHVFSFSLSLSTKDVRQTESKGAPSFGEMDGGGSAGLFVPCFFCGSNASMRRAALWVSLPTQCPQC